MSRIPFQALGVTYNFLHHTPQPSKTEINADLDKILNAGFPSARTYYCQYGGQGALMPLFEDKKIKTLLSLFMFDANLNDWVPKDYETYMKPNLGSDYLSGVLIGNEDFDAPKKYKNYKDVDATILKYLDQAKQDISKLPTPHIPVSSAHTSTFWLDSTSAATKTLASHSEFIAVNIYPGWNWFDCDGKKQPYIDGTTTSMTPAEGLKEVKLTYQKIANAYPAKQIVLTEIGWPTTYGLLSTDPKQYQIGLDNANEFLQLVRDWVQQEQIVAYYYSMFDAMYGPPADGSPFNFNFGRLSYSGAAKVANA